MTTILQQSSPAADVLCGLVTKELKYAVEHGLQGREQTTGLMLHIISVVLYPANRRVSIQCHAAETPS